MVLVFAGNKSCIFAEQSVGGVGLSEQHNQAVGHRLGEGGVQHPCRRRGAADEVLLQLQTPGRPYRHKLHPGTPLQSPQRNRLNHMILHLSI